MAEYHVMAYSDFSFHMLKRDFGLTLIEDLPLFPELPTAPVSEALSLLLARYIPLALNISTEKARSEFIIAPILADLKFQHPDQLSLFSGVDFTVDEARGLKGRCDYILSLGREQLMVSAPICVLVEAKNEQIVGGIPQCLAEMIAAQEFNVRNAVTISPMYGVVTTGSLWRFLKLIDTTAYVDVTEYPVQQLTYILGILQTMTRTIGSRASMSTPPEFPGDVRSDARTNKAP